jgi:drug/metabolite transporter (DMT)-like permease
LTPARRASWWWPLAAAFTSVLGGTGIVATRLLVAHTAPASLAFMRAVIGSLCVLPFVIARPRAVPPREILRIGVLGALFIGAFPLLLSVGLQHTTAAHASIGVATVPSITFLLALLVKRERFAARKLLGIGLSFAGVLLAEAMDARFSASATHGLGALLVLSAALCLAGYNVFCRSVVEAHPTISVTAYSMFGGALFLLPFAYAAGTFTALPEQTPVGWATILFLGVAPTALGTFLWLFALGRATPTQVAICLNLNPLTASALGIALLSERATIGVFLGLVCTLAGIWVVTAPERRSPDGKQNGGLRATHRPPN